MASLGTEWCDSGPQMERSEDVGTEKDSEGKIEREGKGEKKPGGSRRRENRRPRIKLRRGVEIRWDRMGWG